MNKNQLEEHWKNYEVQNPDGSWTTVANLFTKKQEELVEELKKEKYTKDQGIDIEMKNYNEGLDKAISLVKKL